MTGRDRIVWGFGRLPCDVISMEDALTTRTASEGERYIGKDDRNNHINEKLLDEELPVLTLSLTANVFMSFHNGGVHDVARMVES